MRKAVAKMGLGSGIVAGQTRAGAGGDFGSGRVDQRLGGSSRAGSEVQRLDLLPLSALMLCRLDFKRFSGGVR